MKANMKKYVAESFGTFWLVLGGCGSTVLAATFPDTGIGFLGIVLAFGLTVLTMAFAIGHISGCHLTPAVSNNTRRATVEICLGSFSRTYAFSIFTFFLITKCLVSMFNYLLKYRIMIQ
jgi:hypothetical protein